MSAPGAVRLAVVGSTTMPTPAARTEAHLVIDRAYRRLRERIEMDGGAGISGGAPGIDSWSREIAEMRYGWTVANGRFVEHLPLNRRWEPDGYRARNLLVARDCTHLLRIYRPDSRTYGSGWTADQAERLGKVVSRYVWSVEAERFVRVTRRVGATS